MKQLALMLLMAALALGGELTGTWTGSFETTGPDGNSRNGTAHLDLKRSGQTVTGTAGPNADQQMQISSGKLDGQKLTFQVVPTDGERPTMNFELTFDGDTIKGTATAERDGQKMNAKLDLKRKE